MGLTYMLNVYLKPWFWHMKKEHINIFPDEISAVSGAYFMTVIGLTSGKKSINWGSVGI